MSTATTAATPALLDAQGHHWQAHHHTPDFRSHTDLLDAGCYSSFDPDRHEHAHVTMTLSKYPFSVHLALSPNAARALAQSLMAAAGRAEEVEQHLQQLAAQRAQG